MPSGQLHSGVGVLLQQPIVRCLEHLSTEVVVVVVAVPQQQEQEVVEQGQEQGQEQGLDQQQAVHHAQLTM